MEPLCIAALMISSSSLSLSILTYTRNARAAMM